ncbi:hypothetical protein L3Q82_008188 [Scortum barcoo]|uniref:Uncharacterized protein n=1 Tax=Scortum barcoo TaxID=214431 RepID=A0ACB8WKC3_9TELE|nr:hypothetical protein L3Q82_008188 [Scortum barcoo]
MIQWYKQSPGKNDMALIGYAQYTSRVVENKFKDAYNVTGDGSSHCQDVTQDPEISWSYLSKSAEMNCSHKKDAGHNQMYWYRQRPGENMKLIVYTIFGGQPDYGEAPPNKYSLNRTQSTGLDFSRTVVCVQQTQ